MKKIRFTETQIVSILKQLYSIHLRIQYIFLCFFVSTIVSAQALYLPIGSKYYTELERLEIIRSEDSNLNFSKTKPFNIEMAVKAVLFKDSLQKYVHPLSAVDFYNIREFLMNNNEYANLIQKKDSGSVMRRNTNFFYKKTNHLLFIKGSKGFVIVDPIFLYNVSEENNNKNTLFQNSEGLDFKSTILNKVGLYGFLTNNIEKPALYQLQWINHFSGLRALPGAGYFTYYNNHSIVQYWDLRGGMTFKIANYIDVQLAYDKNFIGSGYRSFILSDYSSPYFFVKLNTRIWKINYQNIYARIMPQSNRLLKDSSIHKYLVVHHLDMNITKWLNIGLFETMSLGRAQHIDFSYLPPVIFLKAMEQQVGSPDKANVGFDLKANIAHKFKVYGQFILDEFLLSEMLHQSRGWWANKYAYQLGIKYINVAGINNLDIQLESNRIRPYTFQHYSLIPNYSNNNESLMHPLGANFQEYIAIIRYQPVGKLLFEGKVIHYFQGLDSAGYNMGANVMESNALLPRIYGFKVGSGLLAKCTYASMVASYEIIRNLFFDLSVLIRHYSIQGGSDNNTIMVTSGIRMNLARREYDY